MDATIAQHLRVAAEEVGTPAKGRSGKRNTSGIMLHGFG